jgi:hypothetical protein
MKKTEVYTGPFPRGRHSHTCASCKRLRNQGAVYCYKSQCTLPQSTETCRCCSPVSQAPAPAWAHVSSARPECPEVARWYVLISEQKRAAIFSALSESQRRQAFEYGLAVTWGRLPQYARDLVTTEWWNDKQAAAAVSDVCIAGEGAIDGVCGDPECICAPTPAAVDTKQHRADCAFMAPVQGPCNCSQLAAAAFFQVERQSPADVAPVADPGAGAQLALFAPLFGGAQ